MKRRIARKIVEVAALVVLVALILRLMPRDEPPKCDSPVTQLFLDCRP
jgi:hypothetical protein